MTHQAFQKTSSKGDRFYLQNAILQTGHWLHLIEWRRETRMKHLSSKARGSGSRSTGSLTAWKQLRAGREDERRVLRRKPRSSPGVTCWHVALLFRLPISSQKRLTLLIIYKQMFKHSKTKMLAYAVLLARLIHVSCEMPCAVLFCWVFFPSVMWFWLLHFPNTSR